MEQVGTAERRAVCCSYKEECIFISTIIEGSSFKRELVLPRVVQWNVRDLSIPAQQVG